MYIQRQPTLFTVYPSQVLVAAHSHAACDAFTMALAKQWPASVPKNFIRLGDTRRFVGHLFIEKKMLMFRTKDSIVNSTKIGTLQRNVNNTVGNKHLIQ